MMLTLITVPSIGLLFLHNKQIQTSVSQIVTEKLSEYLQAKVSVSSVQYSFFKRLQLFDLQIEDQAGDTLIYSEFTNIRFKKFKPEKKFIHIHQITFENAFLNIAIDEFQNNSMHFFVDSIKPELPSYEKTELIINNIDIKNSRFRQSNDYVKVQPQGIDFSDLYIKDMNIEIDDFHSRWDTTNMHISKANAREVTGFVIDDLNFDLSVGLKFMTFSKGNIVTSNSHAKIPQVDFRFNNPRHFKYIYDSIDMYIASNNSDLDFYDISYFVPKLADLNGSINLSGNIEGKFSDFVGEIQLAYREQTELDLNMNIKGLPNTENTLMAYNIRKFNSTAEDIKELTLHHSIEFLNDTALNNKLGTIAFEGSFMGYINDFETYGLIDSDVGSLAIDLKIQPEFSNELTLEGSISSDNLHLGDLLNQEEYLADANFHILLEGFTVNKELDLDIHGAFESIGVYGYDYSNLLIDGNFNNRRFNGSFSIKDPNIDLSFTGNVDLNKELPHLDFTIDVANLRPYYLKLRNDDPEYFASFLLKTNISGLRLSDINGEVQLVNSLFRRTGSQLQVYDFHLYAENTEQISSLKLQSDQLDAEIFGKYDINKLANTFKNIVNQYTVLYPDEPILSDTSASIQFTADLKGGKQLFEFFLPDYEISNNSHLKGSYKSTQIPDKLKLTATLPYLELFGFRWENFSINADADTNLLGISVKGDYLTSSGGLEINKPVINASFSDNKSDLYINWDNNDLPKYSGKITSKGQLFTDESGNSSYIIDFMSSDFYYDDNKFEFSPSSMLINKDGFAFDSLLIFSDDQFILTNGRYSNKEEDELTLSFGNININTINALSKDFKVNLNGRLSGKSTFKKEGGLPVFTSNLRADSLSINQQFIGKTSILANWIEEEEKLHIDLHTGDEIHSSNLPENSIKIKGDYYLPSGRLDFDLDLQNLNLSIFEPILEKGLDEISGYGSLDLTLDGFVENPELNGEITFNNAMILLNPTKTMYRLSDKLRIYKNDLFFDGFNLIDEYGNSLAANGNISTSDFSTVFFNLDLKANNFKFLGTGRNDNEQFYGNVFASASARVSGPLDQLSISVDAKTEKFTSLKMPLYNAAEIQSTDYITFISLEEDEDEEITKMKNSIEGLTLDMDLDIASNTSVELIFDPNVGDAIEASGNGTLKIKIDENDGLSVFGNVSVEDGEYLLTLQNVINKRFRVKPGGTITWNGSPTDAIINLDAIYETKASTYSLAPIQDESLRKRIPVHCLLNLQGDLKSPTITPSIELPTAEPETRNLVEKSIGTDEELMRQFISLLVIQNFINSNAVATGDPLSPGLLAGGVTASELFSNQVSNILSKISNDFDIGVNLRPGDEVTSNEIGVALSTQLLNDRIIFSGNLDYLGDEPTPGGASNIVGDFDLEFRVTDKVSLKAFNRVNDDRVISPALYTQGVGIFYRSEFNKLSDIFTAPKNEKPDKSSNNKAKNNAALKEEESE